MVTLGIKMDRSQLTNLVRVLDKDNSGQVSCVEIAAKMLTHDEMDPHTAAAKIYQMMDKDKKGCIPIRKASLLGRRQRSTR